MRRKPLRLSDLRSLERRSMYSIFHPLNPADRLTREEILESRRHWTVHRTVMWLAAVLYLPGAMVLVLVLASLQVNLVIAFAAAGLLLVAVLVYAIIGEYR